MRENNSPKAARRAQEAAAKQAQDKKYRLIVTVVCCVLVVMVVFVAFFGSNLFYNGTTAVDVNGYKYTVADFNYNYFTVYNNYYSQAYATYGSYLQYLSGLLPTTATSFRDQVYSESDGVTVTWAEFFEEAALQRMERVAMLVTEAKAAGYTLPDEDKAAIDETIEGLRAQAVSYGYGDFQTYLTNFYGKGMTEKIFRENLERDAIATGYSTSVNDSFIFTPAELEAHYAENADDYDVYTYRTYYFSGAAVSDDEETEEDETVSAEDAMAKAEADAKAFAEAVSSEQDYIDYAASLHEDDEDYDADASTKVITSGSSLSATIKDWMISADRNPGDVEAIKTPDDSSTGGWYVIYFMGRDDNQYQGVAGYYALVANSTEISSDDYETDEEYHEALQADAEKRANELLAAFVNGAGKDYDTFVNTMENASSSITEQSAFEHASKTALTEEASDWLHDEARTEGDVTVVYSENYGALVLYFKGYDGVYADYMSENALRAEKYNDWETGKLENYKADKEWEMVLSKKIMGIGG